MMENWENGFIFKPRDFFQLKSGLHTSTELGPLKYLMFFTFLTFNELVVPSVNGVFIELRCRLVKVVDLDGRRTGVAESHDLFTPEAGPVSAIVIMRPTDGDITVADDLLLWDFLEVGKAEEFTVADHRFVALVVYEGPEASSSYLSRRGIKEEGLEYEEVVAAGSLLHVIVVLFPFSFLT